MNPLPLALTIFSSELFGQVISVAGWAALGVVLTIGALKLFDLLTPGELQAQVFTEKNNAAAVVYGAALIASAIVIASAMH